MLRGLSLKLSAANSTIDNNENRQPDSGVLFRTDVY